MNSVIEKALNVEIELVKTWPHDFLKSAVRDRNLVINYQIERQRIDELYQDDVLARVNPPINRYQDEYFESVDRLDEMLTQHCVVGYHCTRLTPKEIHGIKSKGLRQLSTEFIYQRLDQCVVDGYLSRHQRETLGDCHALRECLSNKHGHRTGMIWLCGNRSSLRQAPAVYRLLRSWGGEVVYGSQERDADITTALRNIGIPCIVKCSVPFPCEAPYYPKFAAHFLSQLVANDIEYPDPAAKFDLCIRQDVQAAQVLEVIEFSDPQFEEITGCSSWHPRYAL